ncbi:MAG: hypothetical protein AAFO29_19275 [Actinomycetota bacterium]
MIASVEVLAVLGGVVVAGLVWLFRNGNPLAKTAAVVTGAYMTVAVVRWKATGQDLHPIEASHGLGIVAMVAVGLLVLRYAAWAIPTLIVAGCVVLVGGLGATVVEAVGR